MSRPLPVSPRCPLVLLVAALLPLALRAQVDVPKGGTVRYDRLADSTTWVLGGSDLLLLHGAGDHPPCAQRATIVRVEVAAHPATVIQARDVGASPTLRVLIDSAGQLTRTTLPGQVAPGRFNGWPAVVTRYPVPDSLVPRLLAATRVEGADDRYPLGWPTARHLRGAPPLCAAAPAAP